jgi:membrane protease YdiL (CAAX protease family)
MLHTIFAALFVIAFAISLGLFAAGAVTKSQRLLTWGTWGFVSTFVLLLVLYSSGFPLKQAILSSHGNLVINAAEKHHRMSKFVLTGCILIAAGCSVVLFKFRTQAYPNWFAPNLLFISLMLIFFLLRSLVTGFGINWAEQKQKVQDQTNPQAFKLESSIASPAAQPSH